MRTCIDRLIAQPRLGGQLVRQESEFIANRLDILRHEGTISNDAYLDSGSIQGGLTVIASLIEQNISDDEINSLMATLLSRSEILEKKYPGLSETLDSYRA